MKTERFVVAAAMIAGISYVFADAVSLAPAATIVWKGAGVALLAIWCAMQARSRDGWMIAAVLAFGAAGDVLLETSGLIAGAAAFLVGHWVAIALYSLNVRKGVTASQNALAVVVAIATPVIAWLLTRDQAVAHYSLWLGLMAALAWRSRFPRYRVGIGAMLFVASDLLIFARIGPLSASALANFLI